VVLALAACTDAGESPSPSPTPSPSSSASASLAANPPELAAFYDQKVRWSGCGGGFDCTKVKVPLDYTNPQGETIELDVVRLKGRSPLGSLVLNPGGPGGSGVDYARAARAVVSDKVRNEYDVVGFDPRGVVNSEPVDCVDDAQLDALLAADGTPDTPDEVSALGAISREMGAGCRFRSPEVAAQMDTLSAARDLDILREVLGDERLNMLGKSYGSFLGATYADLFPSRVGRLVLDGILPASLDSDEITLGQAKAFDVALRRFVEDCIGAEDCPLPPDVDDGIAAIQGLLDDLDARPLPGIDGRMLTESMATSAILYYLYFPPTDWEALRYGLQDAFNGDGAELMRMLDERVQRRENGTYADNSNEAFYAVSCLDRPAVGGVDHAQELAKDWAEEAPVFGPFLAWGNQPCWQWPFGPGTAEAAGDPAPITATGTEPILVVSTTYDPATPHEWGVQVAGELENAALLTLDGDGHTAYTSGSKCIDDAVDDYLLRGRLPAEGTVCTLDPVEG
jgi:pimeloyl-ACP methyl ester carboxylesterase